MRRQRRRALVPLVMALTVMLGALTGRTTTAQAADRGVPPDRAVTTDGDMTGLHVLVADSRDGYAWRTAATLSEPGTETDEWIGQSCTTGSGRKEVVVYAPRQLTNRQGAFGAGALAAVVDLDTGAVVKLPEPVSLAYYDPGCGSGESAVLTAESTVHGAAVTRLMTVDTGTGRITATTTAKGRITSAVPTSQGIVAAAGNRLVRVTEDGGPTTLVRTKATPFRLAVDARGGVGYETQDGSTVQVHRFSGRRDQHVLTAPARSVRLTGKAGRLYVLGTGHAGNGPLPETWRRVRVPVDSQMSTTGALAVDNAANGSEAAGDAALRTPPTGPQPIRISTTTTATGSVHHSLVQPRPLRPAQGSAPSPAVRDLARGTSLAAPPANAARARKAGNGTKAAPRSATDTSTPATPATTTTDPDRACAIPRNDPKIQSLQPTPQMAEWAADLAVKGALTVQRPAGYNGSDLPAYTPQGLFPPHALIGGGQVPAQVLLGVMAQESNMWQASPHAVDGESGNFEQGGFYGNGGSLDYVDFADADCGYGAMQVTTGMSVSDGVTVFTHDQQVALTVDYAANIAAGLEILQDKWNQLTSLGVIANNGDPRYIENWWFALWAYNTGWHYENDPGDPFSEPDIAGLGWSNNIRNNDYPADRSPFLSNVGPCQPEYQDGSGNCIDAKHPNDWSYPERVMGFASHSLTRYDWQHGVYGPTFLPGIWEHGPHIPPLNAFCTLSGNQCDPSTADDGNACTRADFSCYWHDPVTWISDLNTAGTEALAYQPGSPEPAPYRFYRPDCDAAGELPSNALVIDDVPADVHTQSGCAKTWTQHGSLTFTFAPDQAGNYSSKVDFHQLDTGFGGHFWMADTWNDTLANAQHGIRGTWTLDQSINGWARVLVYIPDHGAMDPQAAYHVNGSDSTSSIRTLPEGNYLDDDRKPAPGHWESLGSFHFNGVPSVSLDNLTRAGLDNKWTDALRDVSWDAVAFQPLPGKPADQVVAMGDSYSSGEGASNDPVDGAWDYYRSSDHDGTDDNGDDTRLHNACHRSPYAWSRQMKLPDDPADSVGSRLADRDPTLDYHMTACSGAVTDNILPGHTGQYEEGAQLDQGYLDQYTSLVTLSIGGNDAGFSDIVAQCIYASGLQLCQNSTLEGDSAPLKDAEPERIQDQVGPAVENVLRQIHTLAPNARILLMGYPRLFDDDGQCIPGIGTDEAPWLQQMADTLDGRLSQAAGTVAADGIPATFADPRDAFTGKAACGDPEEIHGVDFHLTRGDTPELPLPGDYGVYSAQSFHPTVAGATTYASVATSTLGQG